MILVDNGSADGTVASVPGRRPDATVVELGRNRGAPARNLGVRLASTPYVAFADDDSWWHAGALARAADVLDAHPRAGGGGGPRPRRGRVPATIRSAP